MPAQGTRPSCDYKRNNIYALRMAHLAFGKSLSSSTWSIDDFYSAMAVYRKVSGIDFNDDDDESLDKWLEGACAVWRQEVEAKGDGINLAEVLEKAIDAGMKAVGLFPELAES